jgi:hypothetical protein
MRIPCLLTLVALGLSAQETVVSTALDRAVPSLTLYQGRIGYIRETRSVKLPAGPFRLHIEDLPRSIMANTAQVESLDHPESLAFLSKSFELSGPDFNQVLPLYKGLRIKVAGLRNGSEITEEAILLDVAPAILLQFQDRLEVMDFASRRLILPPLPMGFSPRKVLDLEGSTSQASTHQLGLSYLCGDMSWSAEYAGVLNQDETQLHFETWAILANGTDKTFQNATVQLVAGDVPIPQYDDFSRLARRSWKVSLNLVGSVPPPPPPPPPPGPDEPSSANLGEHYVYTLPTSVNLIPNQARLIALIPSRQVLVKKEYVLGWDLGNGFEEAENDWNQLPINAFITFKYTRENHLGDALPNGTFRIYKPDLKGVRQFLSETQMPESASGMQVRLALGAVSEITAKGHSLDHKVVEGTEAKSTIEEKQREIQITNRKAEAQTVHVQIAVGGEWQVLESNQTWKKESAQIIGYNLTIPAKGKTNLKFRVRIKS